MTVPSNGEWRADPAGRYVHRWWDGVRWTQHVSSGDGAVAADPIPVAPPPMSRPPASAFPIDPRSQVYTGPIPSPAKPWAPWVVVTTLAVAISNAVACVLNLMERHYQQQMLTSHPPSVDTVRHTIRAIRGLSTFGLVVATLFLIVTLIWSAKRRPRSRLRQFGETAVEPALRTVIPAVYIVLFVALGAAVLFTTLASSAQHQFMTVNDFVSFRTRLALGDAARSISWACWTPLVVRATQLQGQREAAALAMRGR